MFFLGRVIALTISLFLVRRPTPLVLSAGLGLSKILHPNNAPDPNPPDRTYGVGLRTMPDAGVLGGSNEQSVKRASRESVVDRISTRWQSRFSFAWR